VSSPLRIAHFAQQKILILAPQTALIFDPASLIEGVVDRGVG
jgi:hypothetical protein